MFFKYSGTLFSITLNMQLKRLKHLLDFNNSDPNSNENFSFDTIVGRFVIDNIHIINMCSERVCI